MEDNGCYSMVHHEKSKDGAPSRSQIGNSLVRGIGAGLDLMLSTRCKSWLGFGASTVKGTGLQVQSIHGELRSHELLSLFKKNEREREKEARLSVLTLSFPTSASNGHQRHSKEETRHSQDPSLRKRHTRKNRHIHTDTHKTSSLAAGKSSLLAAMRWVHTYTSGLVSFVEAGHP